MLTRLIYPRSVRREESRLSGNYPAAIVKTSAPNGVRKTAYWSTTVRGGKSWPIGGSCLTLSCFPGKPLAVAPPTSLMGSFFSFEREVTLPLRRVAGREVKLKI